ncbi:MAG: transporter [Chitinophagaceae bacterium]|nr:transporter [Chitinophagaceae bacterium]
MIQRRKQPADTDSATGYGVNPSWTGGRFLHKNGRPNVERRGLGWIKRHSWYHTFLQLSRWKFFGVLLVIYISINLVFATLYFFIGISPVGLVTSSLATFEAFLGLLNFAIATGLFYGRFSRPQAFIHFSHNALIAPYQDGIALMFRLAPYKNNYLSNAHVKLTLARTEDEGGKAVSRFYTLPLEIERINTLNLSWTVVHPIHEQSPLYGTTLGDWMQSQSEILVFLEAFDDTFSNTVIARASYAGDELVVGARFVPMYHKSTDGSVTVMELDMLNAFDRADIGNAFPLS